MKKYFKALFKTMFVVLAIILLNLLFRAIELWFGETAYFGFLAGTGIVLFILVYFKFLKK